MTVGDCDLFVREIGPNGHWDTTLLPQHQPPSSYNYTSMGMSHDELIIEGPHEGE